MKEVGTNVRIRGRRIVPLEPKGEEPDEGPSKIRVREVPRIYDEEHPARPV